MQLEKKMCKVYNSVLGNMMKEGKNEENILFNNEFYTFYLQ